MKKVNRLNIIFSFFSLIIYMFNMLKYGNKYLNIYGVEMLYLGAFLSVILIMFSFFKSIRNSIWMDIIYMIYVLMFIGANYLNVILGSSRKLYGALVNYPTWYKYLLIINLLINLVFFIKSFRSDDNE